MTMYSYLRLLFKNKFDFYIFNITDINNDAERFYVLAYY